MSKFVSLEEAMSLIPDECAVISGGFGSLGSPEELYSGLADRYEREGHPKDITFVCGITPGDKTDSMEPYKGFNLGPNKMRAPGLIKTLWVGNLTDAHALAYMADRNEIFCYMPPMGVMCNLFRCAAGKRPGLLTKVGLHTFADPRNDGCCFNQKSKDGMKVVELMNIDGEEYLFYKTPPADVAFIRATYADEDGNLSMIHEGIVGTELEVAVAAHNNGGIVIAQVEAVVPRNSLKTRDIRIHNKLVDYIVVAEDPMNSRQCYATMKYRPELSGEQKLAGNATKVLPLTMRKVIARRAAMELRPGVIVNLGSGIPSGIGSIAAEEGMSSFLTCSVESGPMGGQVQEGLSFPGVANADCIFSQTDTIDMYDGGMLDMAFLGGAEFDEHGNVNVSKFAGRSIGAGGYIDISQNAKKLFLMGNFTATNKAKGLKANIECADGGLNIISDGDVKFVKNVEQITFSGEYARKLGQEVMYITERAVFRLTPDGLELIEIAPGVDLNRDVLDKMAFKPLISKDLKLMDARLFKPEVMGIKDEIIG
ncbi:MAG: 3-oxoacid CoA-transferase [Oscillospiraceae bacterium]|nr:3-oxoacid CoA-transferase [Oscillospiraceae bacterium]